MSDDLLTRLRNLAQAKHDDLSIGDEAAAEIARLRALCDRQSTALSLSGMRHGRILVGLERRNARQRRALAKLYQRRHEQNTALATARREGMKDAARWHEVRSMELSAKAGSARNFRQLLRQSDFHMESAAELRAAAK